MSLLWCTFLDAVCGRKEMSWMVVGSYVLMLILSAVLGSLYVACIEPCTALFQWFAAVIPGCTVIHLVRTDSTAPTETCEDSSGQPGFSQTFKWNEGVSGPFRWQMLYALTTYFLSISDSGIWGRCSSILLLYRCLNSLSVYTIPHTVCN